MELKKYLSIMKDYNASDLFFTTGAPASVKAYGKMLPLNDIPLTRDEIKALAYETMDKEKIAEFEKKLEMSLALADPDLGRFRVSVFMQRADVAMVIRLIQTEIPTLASLKLPSITHFNCRRNRFG